MIVPVGGYVSNIVEDMYHFCQTLNIEIANNKGIAKSKLNNVFNRELTKEHPHSGYYNINGHNDVYLDSYFCFKCKYCVEELCTTYDTHTYLYDYEQYDNYIIASCFCNKRMRVFNEHIDDFIEEQNDTSNNLFGDINLNALNQAEEEKQLKENSTIEMGFDSWPVALYENDIYYLEGTISSDYNITQLTASVLNNNGDIVIATYDLPNSLDVNIINGSYCNLPFEQLTPGTYQLIVEAQNEADKIVTISDYFSVVELPEESTLTINGDTLPLRIVHGNSFGLRGNVVSNYNITEVYGKVLDSNGGIVLSSYDSPYSNYMDIRSANLNWDLIFNKLNVGEYTLLIDAYDESGAEVTLTQEFAVIPKNTTANTSNPTKINKECYVDGLTIDEWNKLYGHIIYDGNFQPTYMDVKTNDATVHISALDASAVVGYPSKGITLAVIGKCTNKYNNVWYLVEYNGKVCYIYSGDLKTSQTKKNEKPNVADIILNGTSDVLTVVSLIPAVDTFANLLQVPVDILRDDWASAGLSLAGAVPFIGEAADATKTVKLVDKSADAIKATEMIDEIVDSTKITGFTKHGLAQIMGRDGGKGVSNKALIDAVKTPIKKTFQASNNTTKYVGQNAVVKRIR